MSIVTHEMMDASLSGLQGMKWVDANYDGKISSVDPVWGAADAKVNQRQVHLQPRWNDHLARQQHQWDAAAQSSGE